MILQNLAATAPVNHSSPEIVMISSRARTPGPITTNVYLQVRWLFHRAFSTISVSQLGPRRMGPAFAGTTTFFFVYSAACCATVG
jgi:hypothetical protein